MRATIDIPDATYRELKMEAARDGKTIRELVLDGIAARKSRREIAAKKPFVIPVIPSQNPGTLKLTSEQVYDIIGFP